jgi:tetratricopeptide (TPR) repeat protein
MAEYDLSGRNPAGRKVFERVEAASAAEAVKLLEQRDYTDIVLHSSDTEVSVREQMEALHGNKNAYRIFTPREFVGMRKSGAFLPMLLLTFPKVFQYGWWSIVVIVMGVLVRLYWTGQLGERGVASIIMLVAPLVLVSLGLVFGNYGKYRRLVEARARGRWDRVLALLPSLKGQIPADQIDHFKALAFAGLGRLDEALSVFERHGDGKQIPKWRYWSHCSSIYAAGNDDEGAVLAMEKAAELGPTEVGALLDYAIALIRRRRDPRRARQVLDEALKYPVPDIIAYSVDLCRGLIALDENRPYDAVECLKRALDKVLERRNATPLYGMAADRIRACLAIAYAATGDYETALRHYRIAEPRLVALRYDDLRDRFEKAVGLAPKGSEPGDV